jgi:hypothetical protein
MSDPDVSQRRATENHALFRDIDDGLRALSDEIDGVILIEEFICECHQPRCAYHIALTSEEYEAVREVPTRFAVCREHVDLAFDRVIEVHERYAIVERWAATEGARKR